jgi:hypothetical protein
LLHPVTVYAFADKSVIRKRLAILSIISITGQ